MKRILIVEVNWVGDVLFTTPFIRALREAYPESHISCLIHPRCREVLASNPRVNDLVTYDEEGAHRGIIGKAILARELARRRYDTAFILHRSFTKALLTLLAGIPERIGYGTKHRSLVLTRAVDETPADLHKVQYFLRLAEAAGIRARSSACEFFVTDADRERAGLVLAAQGVTRQDRYVVINPGGNWDPKRWPWENFALLGDRLVDRFGVRIVITGAEKDIGLAGNIKGLMKRPAAVAAGKTGLGELGALLERSELVVANDSGPMHMAVAVGARVIALFGPTSPELTGPSGGSQCAVLFHRGKCAVPCYDTTCAKNDCMSFITVDEVLAAAEKMLVRNGAQDI